MRQAAKVTYDRPGRLPCLRIQTDDALVKERHRQISITNYDASTYNSLEHLFFSADGDEMTRIEAIVEGTLQPDGTLVLDSTPNISPGRVTVVLRQEAKAPPPDEEDWFQFLMAARKRMEEAGCHFMNDDEVQAHIDWLRESDQIDELLRRSDDERRTTGQP